MCGIAGIADLSGGRSAPPGALRNMADAIVHRGPDEDGYFEQPGLGLANRRLSIVGLADGRQPFFNEDRSVAVVFNGELFDYPEIKKRLEDRGHRFASHCDTEVVPHLWEDLHEDLFTHLRGQFALALWDFKKRLLILARDRFGICPLYWTRQRKAGADWLLFGSEIKALLASGMVEAKPDLHGIDQVFNFFAVPGPATCFEGIQLLQPGHCLRIQLSGDGSPAPLVPRAYWSINFPDRGEDDDQTSRDRLIDSFEKVMLKAVERRLRADVPVVSYLSGGVDSSLVTAMAAKIRGSSLPTFTIQITAPGLDETAQAAEVSRQIGAQSIVVPCGDVDVLNNYPELIHAAEAPVVDTSCCALLLLAREVHRRGYKVALTGEGADEWLGGYGWFKFHRALGFFDVVPGVKLSGALRRALLRAMGACNESVEYISRVRETLGDHTAFQDIYGLMSLSRRRFFNPWLWERLGDRIPYLALEPDRERMSLWHPMHRAFYWAGRIHLAGHLLSLKGDRVAMNSSVETRYPFLDEEVFDFLARVHPRWKMRGFQDKYLLRLLAERYLPAKVAWRPKGMFRAPLDSFFSAGAPLFVDQLLSEPSLRKSGYFESGAVRTWAKAVKERRVGFAQRPSVMLGLVAVLATQLWHHIFIDAALCDLPAKPPLRLGREI